MRHGMTGSGGNSGLLESVTYRFHWRGEGSNPTLSANFASLVGVASRLPVCGYVLRT
jgi:hypothetical protein